MVTIWALARGRGGGGRLFSCGAGGFVPELEFFRGFFLMLRGVIGLVGAGWVSGAVEVPLLAVNGREISGSRMTNIGANVNVPDEVAGR